MILWVADIGGTNCRLAEFECDLNDLDSLEKNDLSNQTTSGHLILNRKYTIQTSAIVSAENLVNNLQDHFNHKTDEVCGLGIAVAGPVKDNQVQLTNAELALDGQKIKAAFGFKHVLVINDFMAQAYACLDCLNTECINDKVEPGQGLRAILGVGTGLGCATLMPYGQNGWLAFPSEAGHIPFPFEEEEETYARWLKSRLKKNILEAEDILSGRGLQALHTFMTGKVEDPKDILATAQESVTQYWWSGFYGRFCRILALTVLPFGGLWISGGIAIKNPKLIRSDAFASEFDLSNTVLKNTFIPVFLFKTEQVGIYGCARALLMQINPQS